MKRCSHCGARRQQIVVIAKVAVEIRVRIITCSTQHAHHLDTASLHTRNIDPHLIQGGIIGGNIIQVDRLVLVEVERSNDEMGSD